MRKKPTTALYHTSKQNPCMANARLAHSPPFPNPRVLSTTSGPVASAYVPVSLGFFCFVQANLASTYKANHFLSFQTQLLKRKKNLLSDLNFNLCI